MNAPPLNENEQIFIDYLKERCMGENYGKTQKVLAIKFGFKSTRALTEMLDLLAKLGAIDKELWSKHIIWSENFIGNLARVYSKRAISAPEKVDILSFRAGTPPKDDVSGHKNPQSKVKETNTMLHMEYAYDDKLHYWQYHLQQMVLEPDPIQYLAKFLEVSDE